ncbi:hypothetical protein JCM4814A_52890 [Streptomyces phaeofaciens JCM 4814]|uniref:Uncharacterized protein n=1 Tax=Streptomyces phaeofaciens TaxID=68254 RepID=A0A918HPA0_9ACTN|nr:hypothetical protein GCM10010226_68840 [Streptomyces phaeofaciens]
MVAAWAGAAVMAMPAEAAARATAVTAFFGLAMRRMIETDTQNLFLWEQDSRLHAEVTRCVAAPRGVRWVAACLGAGARGLVGAVRRHPDKQPGRASAKTPFASCGRIREPGRPCELALNAQVRGGYGMGMASDMPYEGG